MAGPVYTSPYDLNHLGELGAEVTLAPNEGERAALAAWLEVGALESFTAKVRLKRAGDDTFSYDADFEAGILQSCVITLGPVRTHLNEKVHRLFKVPKKLRRRVAEDEGGDVEVTLADDETEVLEGSVLDLMEPILEEMALSIDPYPRAEGAEFTPPEGHQEAPTSPFAVLKKLKDKG